MAITIKFLVCELLCNQIQNDAQPIAEVSRYTGIQYSKIVLLDADILQVSTTVANESSPNRDRLSALQHCAWGNRRHPLNLNPEPIRNSCIKQLLLKRPTFTR